MTNRMIPFACLLLGLTLSGFGMAQTQPSNPSNTTTMEKKLIGNTLALYPMPLTVVGAEVEGPCPSPDREPSMCAKEPMAEDGIVRLSKIEVRPEYLDEYMAFATEVGEVSLRTEPGVLTMYAVAERENPCRITILETYASRAAYEKHIASAHFQKYKQGTLHMVRSLELIDQTPLNPANRLHNFIQ